MLRPAPNVLGFYDGRVEGYRFASGPNWVDDGALSLGIASYAVFDGAEALVYDPHVTLDHARFIRATLEGLGITRFTVVLSHHHLDHIAGTAVFEGCPVIANARTAAHLTHDRAAVEAGKLSGAPAISPLIMPTEIFEGRKHLLIGGLHVNLIEVDIHSDDQTLLWIETPRLLLAGDALEDCVTYVAEPARLAAHLPGFDHLAALDPLRILPNHGSPEAIAAGGYDARLIDATHDYIRFLLRCRDEPGSRDIPLARVIEEPLAAGILHWFAPYEAIHRRNVERVVAA